MPRAEAALATPLRVTAHWRERAWGGSRLLEGREGIGEAWLVGEGSTVATGPAAGRTLSELARALGDELLGADAMGSGGAFPLLIKILDVADWLSVQVHPDDPLAQELEGAEVSGKTEAWYVLEADAPAEIIAGARPGLTPAELARALEAGDGLRWLQRERVRAGDTIYMPAGTIHSLGPAPLVYEVQQSSDVTYRGYDWDRTAPDRSLDIGKFLRAADIRQQATIARAGERAQGEPLVASPYFRLDVFGAASETVLDPEGRSFHAVTATAGSVTASGEGWSETLERFESLVVPAASPPYALTVPRGGEAVVARAPERT